jgi:hypothetical protein
MTPQQIAAMERVCRCAGEYLADLDKYHDGVNTMPLRIAVEYYRAAKSKQHKQRRARRP